MTGVGWCRCTIIFQGRTRFSSFKFRLDYPARVLYANAFHSLNEKFMSGVKRLKSNSWGKTLRSNPFPEYRDRGLLKVCKGPWDRDDSNWNISNHVRRYEGYIPDFVEPALGSNRLVGFEQNVCYDRYGRYSASGLDTEFAPHQDMF